VCATEGERRESANAARESQSYPDVWQKQVKCLEVPGGRWERLLRLSSWSSSGLWRRKQITNTGLPSWESPRRLLRPSRASICLRLGPLPSPSSTPARRCARCTRRCPRSTFNTLHSSSTAISQPHASGVITTVLRLRNVRTCVFLSRAPDNAFHMAHELSSFAAWSCYSAVPAMANMSKRQRVSYLPFPFSLFL
jgi:hypothetical protein